MMVHPRRRRIATTTTTFLLLLLSIIFLKNTSTTLCFQQQTHNHNHHNSKQTKARTHPNKPLLGASSSSDDNELINDPSNKHHNNNNNGAILMNDDNVPEAYLQLENVIRQRVAVRNFVPAASGGDENKKKDKVLKIIFKCLELAQRAPSGFNAQPYKVVVLSDDGLKQKAAAKAFIGSNKQRVINSDATVLFLADRQFLKEFKRYTSFVTDQRQSQGKAVSRFLTYKSFALALLFSSGFVLPFVGWGVRLGVTLVHWLTLRQLITPTLMSAESWSSKNAMLLAMTFILTAEAHGLDTSPMEGYNSGILRRILRIPRRYSIPLVVSTGTSTSTAITANATTTDDDDAGMAHGIDTASGKSLTPRYAFDSVVKLDVFS